MSIAIKLHIKEGMFLKKEILEMIKISSLEKIPETCEAIVFGYRVS